MAQSSLLEAARTSLKDASRILLFDANGNVLAASFEVGGKSHGLKCVITHTRTDCLHTARFPALACPAQVEKAELEPMARVLEDREEAIKHGITLQGTRYEVRGTSSRCFVAAERVP